MYAGLGMLLVFLSVFNYLIDAYTIFAASVLAANTLLRSLFGFAFPLFTKYMYEDLGIHWASCVPAFLALACVPFPFLLYKYGLSIRKHCKYSAQSEAFVQNLLRGMQKAAEESAEIKPETSTPTSDDTVASLPSKETPADAHSIHHTLSRTSTNATHPIHRVPTYEANPYNVDRVHTRESFK